MKLPQSFNHNEAINFIINRIKDPLYRGIKSSQHNRYNMNQVVTILKLLNKYAPNGELMTIRTTDISKRPNNLPEEYTYAMFCDEAKEKAGIGTQDAMRKNLFVDFHRMGLIHRYNKDMTQLDIDERGFVKYVSLTRQGIKLITTKDIIEQYFLFSKGIDSLLGGYINIILYILMDDSNKISHVDIYEYMFFVSAVDTETTFNISADKASELILKYRLLTLTQRKGFIEELKKELVPENYLGNKKDKRDFYNWKNKIEQIFYILNQTVYFEVRGERLVLKTGKSSFDPKNTRLNRSLSEKHLYFKNHNIHKNIGFELHHVVPLSWAESRHHFKLLDKWENMVYIDAYSHAKITQNRNRNVILNNKENDISLVDFGGKEVYLEYKKNILYKLDLQELMKKYNKELLQSTYPES